MDRTIPIKNLPEVSLFTSDAHFEIAVSNVETDDATSVIKLSMRADTSASPQPVTLRWRLPSVNVKGVWKCGGIHDKRLQYDWELEHLRTRISVDAPVISVFGHDDTNVLTFACADAINLVDMNALLREEDLHLYCHVTLFSERHPAITEYETEIRVDTRRINYATSIGAVAEWWSKMPELKPAPVPALARVPLYSTWYNFHQDLDEQAILEECRIAADIGYRLIILDDGWQTLDNNRGYDYTGDWEPDRFADLAGFVKEIHKIGMQFGLWFSVPFCGPKSKAYQRFKGKFLTENHRWAPVFDPRYPEVRDYLIGTYVNALRAYDLDAFKLDFIDDFRVYPETELTKADGRDYANVNAAVDRLLSDVMSALRAIKPEVGIEFRQRYVGPAMRKFGNMFRAFDCPNDPVSNRIRTVDVKLLMGNSAVHSDPQIWHTDEPVEVAALQVLNPFFAVPQMSIHLRHASKDYLDMVRFYTQYWNDHVEILLDGQFTAQNPLANYPILRATKNDHAIVGVYDDIAVTLGTEQTTDVLNAKIGGGVLVRSKESVACQMQIWNCQGQLQTEEGIHLAGGVTEIPVPNSGLLRLTKSK